MAARLTVGHSSEDDAAAAASEAAAGALRGATAPAFAIVFTTDRYDHAALAQAVSRELPGVPWAGCCSAGVFTSDALLTHGIVVGIVSSREMRFGIGAAGPVSADGRAAGRAAVAVALASLPAGGALPYRAVVLLPDALAGNAADVVRGAAEEAGAGVAWAGGGAGDNLRFLRTAQYAQGRAYRDHAIAVAFASPSPLGTGIRHGWQPYGPPTLVTRATGATVLELEFEPAFDVYRRIAESRGDRVTLEDFAPFATRHPFGIPQADGEHVIRDPLAVDPAGGLRCVAEVADGSLVRVMYGPRDTLLAAARQAASDARESTRGPVAGALVFDCVSRAEVLGEAIVAELAAIRHGLGDDVPFVGCFTFGEVGVAGGGVPQLHNKTAALLGLPAWGGPSRARKGDVGR